MLRVLAVAGAVLVGSGTALSLPAVMASNPGRVAAIAAVQLPSEARAADKTHAAGEAAATARTYLEDLARNRDFSGAVLLARHGRVLLSAGFGWANLARRIPNSASTRFRIGSLTKQFTAMAILELQNAGRLALGDRLCSFISRCPAAWSQVTLQELLTHTSGIPDYTTVRSYGRFSRHHLSPSGLIGLVRGRPLLFAPGARWSYSNTGYALLGMVIQRVTGRPYADYLQRRVLTPLGLGSTGYDVNHPPLPAHATGYATWGAPASYIDMSVPCAAGALDSTVGDVYRWDLALLSGRPRLVRPTVLQEMFKPWVLVDAAAPKSGAYGYGWFIDDGGAEYDHSGDINGFVSYNAVFPRAQAEIVVLSNLESSDPRSIAEHLAGLIGIHAV